MGTPTESECFDEEGCGDGGSDHAYVDAKIAAYEPNIPHIEMTVSQPGGTGTPWRFVVPTPLRSAVFVPPFTVGVDDPTGTFDGVEVPAPSGTDDPRWWLVAPVSGAGPGGVYMYDPTDHATVTGIYTDDGAEYASATGVVAGLAVMAFVPADTGGGPSWLGGAQADSVLLAAFPDLVPGDGIDLSPVGDTLVVSTQGPVITDFTSSGSLSAVTGATMYEVIAWGGGGGGGSGRKGAEGSARFGGCGGNGGSWLRVMLPASALTFPVTVTIGAGGAGGASVTTDSTNGNNGTTGGSTSFGSYATVMGGYGGIGGKATAETYYGAQPSGAPVGKGGTNGVGTIEVLATPGGMSGAAGGGGGGGWRNAANSSAIIIGIGGLGTGALTAPSGSGAAGIAATAPLGGTGGNGGTTGTTGGAGGFIAGGGGGGGAGINGSPGTASGAGGAGAKGWLRVIAYR